MKKTLIAFAALSAIAGMAQAQSTVTLYGLLDANIGSFKTNSFDAVTGQASSRSQTNINSGGLNGSRFGFRITEDLGGGLSAIGNLEGGLDIDTGKSAQGGLLFGRQANVGLASTTLGTVTIGRNKSPYYDLTSSTHLQQSTFDPSSFTNNTLSNIGVANGVISPAGAVTAAQYLLANHGGQNNVNSSTALGFNARIDNSIRYTSPNFSGFSASLLYGFGENKTATTSASRTTGATAQYANGPVLVYLGYQSDALATAANGSKPALENTLVGGSYDFGVAKVGASYNRAKLKDITRGGAGISPQKEYALSVAVPLGATTLQAGYAQSKGDTLGKSTGFGVQALYALSKRTTLYTGYSTLKAYDNLASAYVLATPGSSIERSKLFAAGVRHTF